MMSVRSRIPVRFYFDEESRNWGFTVDEPRIVGGGQVTLEEARQAAAEAIAFALEGSEPQDDDEVEYLDVAVG
jgi:predicted RNase H-like HicB family nuclease